MTIAKGLSSGYQPIGGSIVSDEIESIIAKDEFNHGYTYSSHPWQQLWLLKIYVLLTMKI